MIARRKGYFFFFFLFFILFFASISQTSTRESGARHLRGSVKRFRACLRYGRTPSTREPASDRRPLASRLPPRPFESRRKRGIRRRIPDSRECQSFLLSRVQPSRVLSTNRGSTFRGFPWLAQCHGSVTTAVAEWVSFFCRFHIARFLSLLSIIMYLRIFICLFFFGDNTAYIQPVAFSTRVFIRFVKNIFILFVIFIFCILEEKTKYLVRYR